MSTPYDSGARERPPTPPPIASESIVGETKSFHFDLQENQRGRFMKVTEDVRGRRNTIIIPQGAFAEILEALRRLEAFERELPRVQP